MQSRQSCLSRDGFCLSLELNYISSFSDIWDDASDWPFWSLQMHPLDWLLFHYKWKKTVFTDSVFHLHAIQPWCTLSKYRKRDHKPAVNRYNVELELFSTSSLKVLLVRFYFWRALLEVPTLQGPWNVNSCMILPRSCQFPRQQSHGSPDIAVISTSVMHWEADAGYDGGRWRFCSGWPV